MGYGNNLTNPLSRSHLSIRPPRSMKTEIKKITDVEFDLEIVAEAADLADEINAAVNKQKAQTNMKGFRAGKVPTSLVRRVYGKALAYGVAEERVQKAFQETVLEGDDYEVLGQPTITDLEYEFEGDLKAVVRFGVRPDIKLADLSKVKVSRLTHVVEDKDVENEITNLIAPHADLIPDDGPAKDDSYVLVDMQRLDEKGKKPEGDVQEDVPFTLSDENLMPEIKKALVGLKVGKAKKVKFDSPDGSEKRHFQLTLKEVKIRELPELDEEMVKKVTNDKVDNAETLRTQVKEQLVSGWEQRTKDLFQSDVIEKLIELHSFKVPNSVIDMYVESYLEEFKSQREMKELPEGFDLEGFKADRREQAENQARWMFVRDAIIADQKIEVTEDARKAHFETMAEQGGFPIDMLKQYYESMPQMMGQVDQGILSDLVFGYIGDTMKVTDKDKDAYEKEMKKG